MAKHRAHRRRHRRWLLPALVFLAAAFFVRWSNTALQVTHFDAVFRDLPAGFDGCRAAVISDPHTASFGPDNQRLYAALAAEQPDYIFLVGDLLDQYRTVPEGYAASMAQALSAIAPTYYVTGNHEWAAKVVRELEPMLEENGVTVLANRYVMLERGGSRLALLGAEDPNGYADQKTIVQLANEVRAQEGAHTYQLLLSHRNNLYEKYATAGVDLTLSGHAHGGFIRLPGTDGLLGHSPEGLKIFPSYTAGLYPLKHGVLAVSRGLGNQPPTFRLFNRPDVPLVVLQP